MFNKNVHILTAFHVYIEKLFEIESNRGLENSKNFSVDNEDIASDYAVKIENVEFRYFNAEKNTFSNLNINIHKNKHTVITGPNGSGKSTLLGLISGVLYQQRQSFSKLDKLDTLEQTLILNSSLERILFMEIMKILMMKNYYIILNYLKLSKMLTSIFLITMFQIKAFQTDAENCIY